MNKNISWLVFLCLLYISSNCNFDRYFRNLKIFFFVLTLRILPFTINICVCMYNDWEDVRTQKTVEGILTQFVTIEDCILYRTEKCMYLNRLPLLKIIAYLLCFLLAQNHYSKCNLIYTLRNRFCIEPIE